MQGHQRGRAIKRPAMQFHASSAPRTTDTDAFVWVSSYDDFSQLAHKPRGTPCEKQLHAYKLNATNGQLTHVASHDGILNPAFIRHHPSKPIIYAITESIKQPGRIVGYRYDPKDGGALLPLCDQSARGASTCYATIDKDENWILSVSYWDSIISVLPMKNDGSIGPVSEILGSPKPVAAGGLEDHLNNRQSEPHAHAIVLDPLYGKVAFVPDLGEDVIRQYVFYPESGRLVPAGSQPCAPPHSGPHGPRYIEFAESGSTAFVVNELSSTVSVFRYDTQSAEKLIESTPSESSTPLLHLTQLISTLPCPIPPPSSYSLGKNTCGRIAVDPSGNYVLVSNRGHDSIAVYRIRRGNDLGTDDETLETIDIVSTMGGTPRHFQFALGGRYVIVANQDTDCLAIMRLHTDGKLEFTGNKYECHSPNFVCAQPSSMLQSPFFPLQASVSSEW